MMQQLVSRRRRNFNESGWSTHARRLSLANPFVAEPDRRFLWTAPLLATGIALYFGHGSEPHWLTATLPFALVVGLRCLSGSSLTAVLAFNALIVISAGFGLAKLRTELVRAPVLNQPIRNAGVIGYIERIEQRVDKSQRLTIYVTKIDGLARQWTPRRVRIRLRRATATITSGDAIRISARLAGPPPPARPRGYDFARAAYFQRIGAVGFALSAPEVIEIERPQPIVLRLNARLQNLRSEIGARIEKALPGETGIMANALMTGERSGISKATNDLYRDAGIFHILSISGLHMAILCCATNMVLLKGPMA